MDDEGNEWLQPGDAITEQLFRNWQAAARGTRSAQEMTNPVWEWMFRGRIDPYQASEYFRERSANAQGAAEFPTEPRWAGCRMGQSRTRLADGREVWIAGEYEDHYDPDFYIYNDVIVQHLDGRIQIFGYPESVFRPTDFHSATLVADESAIVLIGNIGYPQDRRESFTPVYFVDTRTFQISQRATTGDQPGWISRHSAALSEDGHSIAVRGGNVLINEGMIENIDDWSLHLATGAWQRLTDRKWPRFEISRTEGSFLHLWEYAMLLLYERHPEKHSQRSNELAAELGTQPNMDVYKVLFRPSIKHEAVSKDAPGDDEDGDGDWRTTKVRIDGVLVRFVDDMGKLTIVVEGTLPESVLESLAEEARAKLSAIENTRCVVKRIG